MSRLFSRLRLDLCRLRVSRRGNVAITFALLLMPMLGAIGLAVDYGRILTSRTIAQVGADAAALQAAGIARDLIQQGGGTDAESTAAVAEAKRRATDLFKSYADQHNLKDYTLALNLVRNNLAISATASYSVATDTYLAKLYGQNRYEATGLSASTSSLPSYVDVYLAIDNSQSMGIGATSDEMNKLFKLRGCVFGCHVAEPGQPSSNEAAAKAAGIRLRINVIKDAVLKMIAKAKDDAGGSASYRFAMYLMGINSSNTQAPATNQLSALSGDYAMLTKVADDNKTGIVLGYNNTNGVGDSYMNEQIKTLAAKITASGDGSSQSKSRSYFFLMTDGARDVSGSCTYGHCMGTIDPAACQLLKDKNITVGVLYTTYLPIYNSPLNPSSGLDFRYADLIVNNGVAPKIGPALQKCATSGWFFEASDATGIDTAIAKMFAQTTSAPALTQ